MNGNSNGKRPIWVYVLIAVLIIAFGAPVLRLLGSVASTLVSLILLAIFALALYRLLKGNGGGSAVQSEPRVETCSDIQSLDIKLGAGKFIIEQGENFSIGGGTVKSVINNGVWHISGDLADNLAELDNIVTITVPQLFTAAKADVKLGAGSLLIKGLSSFDMTLEVAAGNMEAEGLYSKKLEIKCGVGKIKADASMHGDIDINCGMGDASLKLTNRAEEFNCSASVGLGKVVIGGNEVSGGGQPNAGAPYNLGIKCGMGSVRVDFGGLTV